MSIFKRPKDYIPIEDKVDIVQYKTVLYNTDSHSYTLSELEYNVMQAVFVIGIATALAECVNPTAISQHGDETLKKNYLSVVALAEKLRLIDTYEDEEDEIPTEA